MKSVKEKYSILKHCTIIEDIIIYTEICFLYLLIFLQNSYIIISRTYVTIKKQLRKYL